MRGELVLASPRSSLRQTQVVFDGDRAASSGVLELGETFLGGDSGSI